MDYISFIALPKPRDRTLTNARCLKSRDRENDDRLEQWTRKQCLGFRPFNDLPLFYD